MIEEGLAWQCEGCGAVRICDDPHARVECADAACSDFGQRMDCIGIMGADGCVCEEEGGAP